MGIAYHKKTSTKYVQYTLRIEESILDKIKSIAGKEDLSINEVVNQSLQFAINDYEKNNNKAVITNKKVKNKKHSKMKKKRYVFLIKKIFFRTNMIK